MVSIERIILAIDHGTSGMKAGLVTETGEVLASSSARTSVSFLPGGGAEQDPEAWWQALVSATRQLLSMGRVPKENIVGLAVSSTFSTTVAVGADGRPLMNAITWMDSRGGRYVREIVKGFPSIKGYGVLNALRWIRKTGGGPGLSGKDDIAHVLFIQHECPRVYEQTRAFLPSKDYLNLRLTGVMAASYDSVQLFWVTDTRDIHRIRYDEDLIRRFHIEATKLPPLLPSTAVLGPVRPEVAEELGLPPHVQVVVGSPDHQSACVGSGAVQDFQGHLYVGTSSWIQCIVPFKKTDMFHSMASLPTAIPGRYQVANEQDMAGGALAYFAQRLGLGQGPMGQHGDIYREMDAMAMRAAPGSRKVIFTPWLNGEWTPVDDPCLRGVLYNLSLAATREDLARAVLEGVAYNARWSLGYVEGFIGRRLNPLHMVGGGAKSQIWCQIFSDVMNRTVKRVKDPLMGNARGAGLIASVGLGFLRFEDVPHLTRFDGIFEPDQSTRSIYDELFEGFLQIHKINRSLFRRLNAPGSGASPFVS